MDWLLCGGCFGGVWGVVVYFLALGAGCRRKVVGQGYRLLTIYADFAINRLTTMFAGRKFYTTKGHFSGIL